jgi:hypothetical protein
MAQPPRLIEENKRIAAWLVFMLKLSSNNVNHEIVSFTHPFRQWFMCLVEGSCRLMVSPFDLAGQFGARAGFKVKEISLGCVFDPKCEEVPSLTVRLSLH